MDAGDYAGRAMLTFCPEQIEYMYVLFSDCVYLITPMLHSEKRY